jgi:ABC-type uncharacterized transport system ATPase subunit
VVEIVCALTAQAKAIILDEPTGVLEDRAHKELFQVFWHLKQSQGVSFSHIYHRHAEETKIEEAVREIIKILIRL